MPSINSASDSLIATIAKFGITLPKNAIEWRVAKRADGTIGVPGHHVLHGLVTHLLTDGIVSWFLLGDHETIFFGHLANWEAAKDSPLRSEAAMGAREATGPKAPRAPTKRMLALTEND